MKNYKDLKEKEEIVDDEKTSNVNEEIANSETEHKPTNEEKWVIDVNKEFGIEPLTDVER